MSGQKADPLFVINRFKTQAQLVNSGKWRTQVINAVRQTPVEKRPKLIHRVCRELQLNLYGKSAQAREDDMKDPVTGLPFNRSTLDGTMEILLLIAQTLLEDGDVQTFLRVQHVMLSAGLNVMDEQTSAELVAIRLPSLMRFVIVFLDHVSSSDEASIRFGVLLAEAWEGLGNSVELDVELLKKREPGEAIRKLVEDVSALTVGERLDFDDKDPRALGAMVMNFMAACATESVEKVRDAGLSMKGWLERIVQASSHSELASEVLASLLNILTSLHNTPALETINANKKGPNTSLFEMIGRLVKLKRNTAFSEDPNIFDSPALCLSSEATRTYATWSDRKRAEQSAARRAGEQNLDWFKREQVTVDRLFDERCRKIMEQPRRGLRPAGYDHVELRVSALRNVGIRAIIFRPEGHVFPDVGIEIVARRETPTLCIFKTELRAFELGVHEEIVRWKEHFDRRDDLLLMLRFVVIDMLYRIVASPQELREKRNWQSTGDASRVHVPQHIPVRPLLRRLPEGFKATERAQQLAQREMGWIIRPGMTFVSAYVRDGQLAYDLPTQPTAIYTDEDLRSETD